MELTEAALRLIVSEILRALSPLAAEEGIKLEALVPDTAMVDINWVQVVKTLSNLAGKMAKEANRNNRVGVQG